MEQWEIDAELDASESRFIQQIEKNYQERENISVDQEYKTLKFDCWKDSTGRHRQWRRY